MLRVLVGHGDDGHAGGRVADRGPEAHPCALFGTHERVLVLLWVPTRDTVMDMEMSGLADRQTDIRYTGKKAEEEGHYEMLRQ